MSSSTNISISHPLLHKVCRGGSVPSLPFIVDGKKQQQGGVLSAHSLTGEKNSYHTFPTNSDGTSKKRVVSFVAMEYFHNFAAI